MIRRLQLSRWRAFESIDLRLDPGTTFVVAPNGVGKTSLLLGIVWAIFGDDAPVNARECIRAGSESAEAEVILEVDGGSQLRIHRTITERGKLTAKLDVDGTPLNDEQLKSLLRETYGVDLKVAAQLSFMVGGGHVASQHALDLKEHLYDAFGITGLRAAAETATALTKAAVKQREGVRSVARQDVADLAAVGERLVELDEAISAATSARAALEQALTDANALRDVVGEWNRYDVATARRDGEVAALLEAARELGLPSDAEELPAAIEHGLAENRTQLSEATERITDARARHRSAQNALALLEMDEPSCPTCLRPFHGAELAEAIAAQHTELADASEEEAIWRSTVATIDDATARLDKLRQSLAQVPPLPHTPTHSRPDRDPEQALQEALSALQGHDAASGQLEHERATLQQRLEHDDEVRRLERAQRIAYRREAISRAVATALTDAAAELTRGYIEPLSEQIRWRWKALFGEEGLQLKPDGTIVRVVGDRELSWDSLSGGERIWARLVTHLLVLGTSTRLPFAWFDEPLEHLDPRARRAVASALATATRAGGPKQLIVTTYEHAIARQLAADVPEASIMYIRRGIAGAPR